MSTNEYWDGHEYVREHAYKEISGSVCRLVEILRTQWDEDYFKDKPFAVRVGGEDFDTFATLDEAQDCFDHIVFFRHEVV